MALRSVSVKISFRIITSTGDRDDRCVDNSDNKNHHRHGSDNEDIVEGDISVTITVNINVINNNNGNSSNSER